jgi:hypothetical protein
VEEAAITALRDWEGFYVIVGTSVAALTGLMFVVIALISENPTQTTTQGLAAFGTPTVVHYAAVLVISGLVTAPWETLYIVSPAITIIGIVGFVYTLIVIRRARTQTSYSPVLEDWLWHTAFPFVGYTLLAIAGILMHVHITFALFSIGAVALLFMITGIHNAWDTVTWITVSKAEREGQPSGAAEK